MPDAEKLLHLRTRIALGALVEAAMIALLWDVSKPLLAAITAFGATALLVAEFGRGPLLIQRYELGLFAVIAKLAALLTFIFCLLAVGLIIYPATFSDWQLFASPLQVGIGRLTLKSPNDTHPSPLRGFSGTYALVLVRTENRGDTNSAEDWELLAKTVGGDSYAAELVEMRGPISGKVRPTEGTEDRFTFYPSDQIHLKTANPMPKGKWYWGFALFAFDDLPLSTLHLPGTVFTLRCKDVVTQRRAQSTLIWRGKEDEWRIFPGMNNVPLPDQPTPVPTAMPLASK